MKKKLLIGTFAVLVAFGGLATTVNTPSGTDAFTAPASSVGPLADSGYNPRSFDPNLNNSG